MKNNKRTTPIKVDTDIQMLLELYQLHLNQFQQAFNIITAISMGGIAAMIIITDCSRTGTNSPCPFFCAVFCGKTIKEFKYKFTDNNLAFFVDIFINGLFSKAIPKKIIAMPLKVLENIGISF